MLAGFKDTADVRLGAAVFNAYDINGVAWVVTDIEGWWEFPDLTLPDDPRPFEHDGSYYTPGRYNPRTMTLSGVLIPPAGNPQGAPYGRPTRDLAAYAREVLGRTIDMARGAAVLRVDEDIPKQAEVQLASKPTFRNTKFNGVVEFQIPLKAGDPRKYAQDLSTVSNIGLARSTGGRTYPRTYPLTYTGGGTTTSTSSGIAYAPNVGTYPTGATIRLYGPVSTPSIEHLESNSTMRFHIDIPAGEYLELNLLDRSVLLNGTTSRRATLEVKSKWFMLQPGTNSIRYNGEPLGSGSDPYMDITYRSAWIS